jgi:hypothetical protein
MTTNLYIRYTNAPGVTARRLAIFRGRTAIWHQNYRRSSVVSETQAEENKYVKIKGSLVIISV